MLAGFYIRALLDRPRWYAGWVLYQGPSRQAWVVCWLGFVSGSFETGLGHILARLFCIRALRDRPGWYAGWVVLYHGLALLDRSGWYASWVVLYHVN